MPNHQHSHGIIDWLISVSGVADEATEVELLCHILKGQITMALSLQALTDSISKLTADAATLKTDVDALIALHTDPSQQTAVDNLATSVASISTVVTAAAAAVSAVLPAAPSPAPAA